MYVARADSGGLDFKIIYLSNCELINYQNVKKKDYFFTFLSKGSSISFSSTSTAAAVGEVLILLDLIAGVDFDELEDCNR